jgi:large subunit ribosomal protein L4
MMELKLIDQQGQSTANVAAADAVFGRDYNEALIHQVVTSYLANARSGTRMQKDRGEVKHSTKKPWRQKGTGRARAGMTSSPLWRGGGRIFPNRPDENFSHKLNRKMYRAGVCAILSQLVREGRLAVVDSFTVDAPKTKLLALKVKSMGFDNVLIVTDNVDENLLLSARNLPNVSIVAVAHADPVSLIRHANVLLTKNAMAKFEELLK